LAEPLACGLGRPRLVIEAPGAGLGFNGHQLAQGRPWPVTGWRC
jgi:hypothetical protein